jgi:trimethylamine--corrinoid protein Co-methyltransferase
VAEAGRKSRRARRGGGREARRALRAAGVRGQAVQPGMPGGAYQPLSESDIRRISDTALDILENIGIGDPIPEILHYALPGGCVLGEDNRLRFPRVLVEDLIDISAKEYICYAPDPRYDLEVSAQKVYFCTSGESVSILDYQSQSYRPTRLVDLYDAARLAEAPASHFHWGSPRSIISNPLLPCSMPFSVKKAPSLKGRFAP